MSLSHQISKTIWLQLLTVDVFLLMTYKHVRLASGTSFIMLSCSDSLFQLTFINLHCCFIFYLLSSTVTLPFTYQPQLIFNILLAIFNCHLSSSCIDDKSQLSHPTYLIDLASPANVLHFAQFMEIFDDNASSVTAGSCLVTFCTNYFKNKHAIYILSTSVYSLHLGLCFTQKSM